MSLEAKQLFFDDWSQLNEKQAWSILYHQEVYNNNKSGYSLRQVLKTALKPIHKKALKKRSGEELLDIYKDTELFFNKPFYEFFTKSIKTKKRILAAPDQKLFDITFENFCYADAAFSDIAILHHNKQDTEAAINKFIATIYLPHNGAKRADFDANDVLQYIDSIFLMPYQKNLIIRAYANIKDYIVNVRCPLVFPAPASDGEPTAPQHTGKMWQDKLFEVAESKAFKGVDKAGKANLYKVLDYLQYKQEHKPPPVKV